MKFIPLDIGTFLVISRSRKNCYHVVNLLGDDKGCSCEGYQFTDPLNTCAHYQEALRRREQGKLPMIVGMNGRI